MRNIKILHRLNGKYSGKVLAVIRIRRSVKPNQFVCLGRMQKQLFACQIVGTQNETKNLLLTRSSRHYQCSARLHHRHADSVCTIWREESSLLWKWHIFPQPPIFSGSLQVHPAWSVSSQESSLIQKELSFPCALPGTAEPPVFLFDMPVSSVVQKQFFFQLPESGDLPKK